MQGFEKYPSYKDSGTEWLGEIPEGWDLRRFKFLFKEINERSEDGTGDLLSVSQYTGVTKKSDKVADGDLLTTASTLDGYKKVYKNDLVSNIMLAWNGSLGFSKYDGITSPAYSIYRLNKGNEERFFHYLVRSQIYKAEFKRNSSGVIESRLRLYTDDFFNIPSILPPLAEQTAIAKFLDEKTEKIDQSIAQKEQLITLLKERKQILIQQAVTKGLNPDAPLKDSGIDWIGDIPEHWEVKKMTHITKMLVDGTHFSPKSHEEGPYKYVTAKNIKEKGFDFSNLTYVTQKDHDDIYPRCPVAFGDVLYIKDGATAGIAMVNDLEEEFSLLSSVALIKPIKTIISSEFLSLYLNSEIIRGFIQTQIVGGALTRLTLELISRFKVIVPSTYEQSKIVNFFIQESSKIDESIRLQERQIEQLKEYKSVLIDSAVTGKIKVC